MKRSKVNDASSVLSLKRKIFVYRYSIIKGDREGVGGMKWFKGGRKELSKSVPMAKQRL